MIVRHENVELLMQRILMKSRSIIYVGSDKKHGQIEMLMMTFGIGLVIDLLEKTPLVVIGDLLQIDHAELLIDDISHLHQVLICVQLEMLPL